MFLNAFCNDKLNSGEAEGVMKPVYGEVTASEKREWVCLQWSEPPLEERTGELTTLSPGSR